MKEKDGIITTDREEILNICAEFYQELYSTQKGGNKTNNVPNMKSTDDTEVPDITISSDKRGRIGSQPDERLQSTRHIAQTT